MTPVSLHLERSVFSEPSGPGLLISSPCLKAL
jgi:hypothetical protein